MIARSRARPVAQRISPEAIYLEGSDVNILLAGASAMGDEAMRQLCKRVAALYLDSAEGTDLDRIVADRFSPEIVRKQESSAVVTLTLTRVQGSLPAITLNLGAKVRTRTGVEFRLTQPVSLALGSTGPASVTAEAVETGAAGNVSIGTITEFVAQPVDPFLAVTNLEVASGGDDVETDPRLRARARRFFQLVRRGTLRAIEQGALTVGGVAQATAYELLDPDGVESGYVQVAIADIAGQANAVLLAAVKLALREFRAAGIVPDVIGAVPTYVPVRLRLRYAAGIDTNVAFEQIVLTLVAAVGVLQPGETLELANIIAACKSVPGVIVLSDAVIEPVGDVVPLNNSQVLRTRHDLVTRVV